MASSGLVTLTLHSVLNMGLSKLVNRVEVIQLIVHLLLINAYVDASL